MLRRDASEPDSPRASAVPAGRRTAKTAREATKTLVLVDMRGRLKSEIRNRLPERGRGFVRAGCSGSGRAPARVTAAADNCTGFCDSPSTAEHLRLSLEAIPGSNMIFETAPLDGRRAFAAPAASRNRARRAECSRELERRPCERCRPRRCLLCRHETLRQVRQDEATRVLPPACFGGVRRGARVVGRRMTPRTFERNARGSWRASAGGGAS